VSARFARRDRGPPWKCPIARILAAIPTLLIPLAARAALPDDCVLRADGTHDGVVGVPDLVQIVLNWGQAGSCGPDFADYTWDCVTGAPDLIVFSREFGKTGCTIARKATIAALPRTGGIDDSHAQAWTHVTDWADKAFTPAPFCDQGSSDDMILFAKALAWAVLDTHGGTTPGGRSAAFLRNEILAEIDNVVDNGEAFSCNLGTGDEGAAVRNTSGYVHAASLLNHRDPDFVSWLNTVMFVFEFDSSRTLAESALTRPNNVGAWAIGASVAAAAYLNRYDHIALMPDVWKRHVGDRSVPLGQLSYGDLSWHSDPLQPVSILPDGEAVANETTPESPIEPAFSSFLLPEERRRDSLISYSPPWNVDAHEAGYVTAMMVSGVLLEAQINDEVPWAFDPWLHAAPGQDRALGRAWIGLFLEPRYNTPSGSIVLEGNDLPNHCIASVKYAALAGGPADHGCCPNPGTGLSSGVARGFGFAHFLFPDSLPDAASCDGL
jgi:hypothetical protein